MMMRDIEKASRNRINEKKGLIAMTKKSLMKYPIIPPFLIGSPSL